MSDDECVCEEGAPAWMATFSDLATLLLTFFVLLLSFAELNVQEFKEMLGSVKEAFGVSTQEQGLHSSFTNTPIVLSQTQSWPEGAQQQREKEDDALEELEKLIEENELEDAVEIEADTGGVIIRIREQLLFPSGSADLNLGRAGEVLSKVADLGDVFEREISIEGHTDDRPISNARFPSNWELSSARATRVLRYFLTETGVDRGRLRVSGYADTHPVAPNDSDAGRARNRRVEFRFHRTVAAQQALESGEGADQSAREADAVRGVGDVGSVAPEGGTP